MKTRGEGEREMGGGGRERERERERERLTKSMYTDKKSHIKSFQKALW